MSEQRHTPGPWLVDKSSIALCGERILCAEITAESSADWIAQVQLSGQGDANARLISAAPDLLWALQDLLEQVESGDTFRTGKAIEAVQKATGWVYGAT